MNIEELNHLAAWIEAQVPIVRIKYENLRAKLQHNSQQPQKQPLETELEDLLNQLSVTPLHILSNEQVKLLEAFEVKSLLGQQAVDFVNATVRKSDFDPATAMNDIQAAISALDQALERANSLDSAFSQIEIAEISNYAGDNRALIRVEFQGDASIGNVVDWNDWSSRWLEISRGIALSIGEAPESVHVVGATRGSIILELTGTYAFVRILTNIVKSVTSVAKEIVMLQQSIEDLRTKRLLNVKIELEMQEEAKTRKDQGVQNITALVTERLPGTLDGEQQTALEKAITQLLDFHRKGGEVDVVAPSSDEEESEGDSSDSPQQLEVQELRALIEELRTEKEELRLLGYESDVDVP
jgi:hypothetical protein